MLDSFLYLVQLTYLYGSFLYAPPLTGSHLASNKGEDKSVTCTDGHCRGSGFYLELPFFQNKSFAVGLAILRLSAQFLCLVMRKSVQIKALFSCNVHADGALHQRTAPRQAFTLSVCLLFEVVESWRMLDFSLLRASTHTLRL